MVGGGEDKDHTLGAMALLDDRCTKISEITAKDDPSISEAAHENGLSLSAFARSHGRRYH